MRLPPPRWASLWPVAAAALFFGALHAGAGAGGPHAASAADQSLRASRAPALRDYRSRWFTIHTDADAQTVARVAGALDEAAESFLRVARELGATGAPAPGALHCVFFARHEDFLRFARERDNTDAAWMGGYYSAANGRIVAYDDAAGAEFGRALRAASGDDPASRERAAAIRAEAAAATRDKLLHEAAHMLAFATGLQKPGAPYPAWVTEGIAESFARGRLGAMARGGSFAETPHTDFASHGRASLARSAHAHSDALAGPAPARAGAEYPGASCGAPAIDAFYARSLALVDAVVADSPRSLAALLRAVEEAPDAERAAQAAEWVAARASSGPALAGVGERGD